MCLLFCCVHRIAEALLQWRRPVYLATLHVVVCILCDFCSWSAGVQYECACHHHFPLLSVLFQALLLLKSTKCTNFWRTAHLQLLSAYIVYFQCVQISVCGIHRWNTGHWPNSLFRGVGLFIFLFWETDQKYVCAWSSVKANWQGLWLNYQFTFANKNISIHVHNCPFQWIHIKSFGKDIIVSLWIFGGFKQEAHQVSHQLFDHPMELTMGKKGGIPWWTVLLRIRFQVSSSRL